jgi:hypothetical protein
MRLGPGKCDNCGNERKPLFTSYFCDCEAIATPKFVAWLECEMCGGEALKFKRIPVKGEILQKNDTDSTGVEGERIKCNSCASPLSGLNLRDRFIHEMCDRVSLEIAQNAVLTFDQMFTHGCGYRCSPSAACSECDALPPCPHEHVRYTRAGHPRCADCNWHLPRRSYDTFRT